MPTPLARLQAMFNGRPPRQPEDLHPEFKPELHDNNEEVAHHPSPYVHVDRAGEVFGIEYETPQGNLSRQWVTVEGFKKLQSGDWYLYAYCFTRRGVKSYAVGRIRGIYNGQGDPIPLSDLFPANGGDAPFATDTKAPGQTVVAACRDGLRVLTALAKIDGTLDPKEIETIKAYAKSECKKQSIDVTANDERALEGYIRNLQPTGDVVAESLSRLNEQDLAAQKEFFWHAREVMDADGLQDEAEIKMILEISEALSHEL